MDQIISTRYFNHLSPFKSRLIGIIQLVPRSQPLPTIIQTNMGISTSDCRLNISTLTWNRFSFNLFDYESSDYSRTNLKIDCQGFLTRKGFDIDFSEELKDMQQVLFKVGLAKNQKYLLEATDLAGNLLKIMRVVKPQEEILVKENDLIQLGRVELRIKRLEREYFPDVRTAIQHCGKAGAGNQCRFCFNQENQLTNPLLAPCQCKGSLKYIHLECLRVWLRTRVLKQERESILRYHWQNLKCELCHSSIQSQIDLLQFQESEQPSISIEIAQIEDDERKVSIFIVPIQRNKEKEIKIGRGKQNDIRINDISVSRQHCTLVIREGKAYLQDNGSKFGTLIEAQREIKIQNQDQIWLQSGRTLIKVTRQYEY